MPTYSVVDASLSVHKLISYHVMFSSCFLSSRKSSSSITPVKFLDISVYLPYIPYKQSEIDVPRSIIPGNTLRNLISQYIKISELHEN